MTLDLQVSLDLLGTVSSIHPSHVPAGVITTANEKVTELTNFLKGAAVLVSIGGAFAIALIKKFKLTGIIAGIIAGGLFGFGVFGGIGWFEGQMRSELPGVSGAPQILHQTVDTVSTGYLNLE